MGQGMVVFATPEITLTVSGMDEDDSVPLTFRTDCRLCGETIHTREATGNSVTLEMAGSFGEADGEAARRHLLERHGIEPTS